MKKHCRNCKHLEWHDADEGGESGYACDKRHDAMADKGKEDEFLDQLRDEKYLMRGKVCCDLIAPEAEIVDLTCPECGDTFTGYARDKGGICFDCFATKECVRIDIENA